MQYSVRSRRRLRPTTGDYTRAAAAVVDKPVPPLAEGSGPVKTLPIHGPVIERISLRARKGCGDR